MLNVARARRSAASQGNAIDPPAHSQTSSLLLDWATWDILPQAPRLLTCPVCLVGFPIPVLFLSRHKNSQPSLAREAEKPQQRAGRLILLTFPFSLQCDTLHHMEEMTLTIYRLTGHFITTTLPQGKAAPFHLPKH